MPQQDILQSMANELLSKDFAQVCEEDEQAHGDGVQTKNFKTGPRNKSRGESPYYTVYEVSSSKRRPARRHPSQAVRKEKRNQAGFEAGSPDDGCSR